MSAQKGRLFLLKIGGTAIGGLRATSMTINNEAVDITNKDSAGWRTLLEGAGVQSVDISVSGIAETQATFEMFKGYAQAGTINAYTLTAEDGDSISGNFLITSFEEAGDYNAGQTFTASLQSSGTVTFSNA